MVLLLFAAHRAADKGAERDGQTGFYKRKNDGKHPAGLEELQRVHASPLWFRAYGFLDFREEGVEI